MTTLLLCSASGAPGVTLTALGLALTWPRDILLVDADRTPSQAVLAGYLRGESARGRGLPGLLEAHRERRHLLDAVEEQSMDLPEPPRRRLRGDGAAVVVRRRFVPGFIRLGTIDLFTPVWRELGQTLHDLHADTLVDAGRVGAHGLPQDLVDASDSVLLVCRTSLPSLAAARIYLSGLQEQAGDKLGLLVVGPGRPYTPQEVAEQFGVPVAAEIPWEPRGADEMFQGGALGSNWWGQRLATGYAAASARWGVPTEARPHPMEVGA